ncbi:hypothetical protein J2T17_004061 [Paenibacillus mucilaginosus]|uniref:hypothetical protein n=1 Tax=Paenibacillus mucilaginosus TaxID=61624 RepID=UPI003D24988F
MDRHALRRGLETIGVKPVQRPLTRAVTVVPLSFSFTLIVSVSSKLPVGTLYARRAIPRKTAGGSSDLPAVGYT